MHNSFEVSKSLALRRHGSYSFPSHLNKEGAIPGVQRGKLKPRKTKQAVKSHSSDENP